MLHFILFPLFLLTPALGRECEFDTSIPYAAALLRENLTFPSYATFDFEEVFYIFCPAGTSNPLISHEGDLAVCKGGDSFVHIPTVELAYYHNIVCQPGIPTFQRWSGESCGSASKIAEIGFEVRNTFIPEVSVCFSQERLATFYTSYMVHRVNVPSYNTYEHTICGNASRPCIFADGGDNFAEINMNLLYQDYAQVLETLDVDPTKYSTLLRVPLASGAFFNGYAHDLQTYAYWDYINVMPMWEESFADWLYAYGHILQNQYQTPEVIYSGTLGVMSGRNSRNESVKLYLLGDQIPIPAWFWVVDEYYARLKLVFNTGGSNIEGVEQAAYKICYSPKNTEKYYVVDCAFDKVIDPDLITFLDSHFDIDWTTTTSTPTTTTSTPTTTTSTPTTTPWL